MSWLSLARIADLVNGRLQGPDRPVEGVFTDTRSPVPDRLFVALKGPRFDAHEYISEGLPAAGVMVSRPLATTLPQVLVEDTRAALGRLAANWRAGFGGPLVGLTGSNGKTTVKEMIAAILSRRGAVLATRGNLNNDVGLPLTLLELRARHAFGVIEMGANHPGEIAYLTSLARPTVALITNAGPAHLEGFGSLWGVARAKGEIFAGLREGGVAVINADDAYADYWRGLNAGRRALTFGLDRRADFAGELSGSTLRLRSPAGEAEIALGLPGRHNARNALAAAAAAWAAGARLTDIRAGLEALRAVPGRLERKRGPRGMQIIDDTYNANPASLQAAVEVLAAQPGRRLLVLGDMRELGAEAARLHAEAGAQAKAVGVDGLYALGELAAEAARAFGAGAVHYASVEELIQALAAEAGPGLVVLFKGSRGMRMERVIAALTGAAGAPDGKGRGHAA